MKIVYKYPLYPGQPIIVSMPVGAVILHVGQQGGQPMIWALADSTVQPEQRTFFVYGTGVFITESDLTYIGTVQVPAISVPYELVWHVFERVKA